MVKALSYHGVTGKPRDIWRESFCNKDPPANVPPFKPVLKKDAVPYICKARKYNDEEYNFLKLHNQQIVEDNMGNINHQSRWASRSLPVKKANYKPFQYKGRNEEARKAEYHQWLLEVYRQTVDYVVVNSKCVPLAGQMPFQDVALEHVAGMEVLGNFDFVTGFSQILNHPDMKEILSVRTPIGIMTPDRMPMGHVD